MPPEKTDLKFLWDMMDAAPTAVEITRGKSLNDYARVLQLAVERSIKIIGEAARRVSESFRGAHPAINWKPIIATRHVMAHEYGDIQHDKVWRIVHTHIPRLVQQLEAILDKHPPGESQR